MSGDGSILQLTREEGGGLRGRFAFGGVTVPTKGGEASDRVKELDEAAGDKIVVLYETVATVLTGGGDMARGGGGAHDRDVA